VITHFLGDVMKYMQKDESRLVLRWTDRQRAGQLQRVRTHTPHMKRRRKDKHSSNGVVSLLRQDSILIP
jgi:hypothetical protein